MCVVILVSMATALGINVHQMTSTPVVYLGKVSDERVILFDSNAYLNLLEGPNSVWVSRDINDDQIEVRSLLMHCF